MNYRRKLAVLIGGAALLVGTLASAASAHVTVGAQGEAAQGGFAALVFSVPNESDTAKTTAVAVQFPADNPIASVSTEPVAGWTAAIKTRHLDQPLTDDDGNQVSDVVDTITWTADAGGGLGPDQFQQFVVSAGPLPTGVTSVELPTVQTKTNPDGSTEEVRWNEPTPSSGEEPEHPTPVLALSAAGAGEGSASAAPGESDSSSAGPSQNQAAASTTSDSSDDSSDTLAIVALVVAVVALAGAAFALLRARRA